MGSNILLKKKYLFISICYHKLPDADTSLLIIVLLSEIPQEKDYFA
jgi:hypothetical protein